MMKLPESPLASSIIRLAMQVGHGFGGHYSLLVLLLQPKGT